MLTAEGLQLLQDGGAALDMVLERRGVARNCALQRIEQPECDGQRGHRQDGPPQRRQVGAQGGPAGHGPLRQHGEEEERESRTDGVGDGDEE